MKKTKIWIQKKYIYMYIWKDIPKLNDWLSKKKGKYPSHDIQNKLLTIMSH